MPEETIQEGTVLTEVKPETTTIGKKKLEKSGDVIMDTAHEVESYSKTKALNEASKCAENIEVTYFKMGGCLKLILDNSWFEGSPDFGSFVFENYGFQDRKARYLISIYDNLVTKQIPWDKVGHLGWTKLKDLASVLTQENVDEWVAKAEKLTVAELQALLKAPAGEGAKNIKPTEDIVKVKLNFKADQAEVYQQAIAKAKGELHTEFDTVAVENICAGYLGGNITVSKVDMDDVLKSVSFEDLMNRVAALYPEYDIDVVPLGEGGASVEAEPPAEPESAQA